MNQTKTTTHLPISEQIRKAFQKTNRMSMISGCLLGGFVPVAVYLTAHSQPIMEAGGVFKAVTVTPFLVLLILGGLVFSATSVVRWGYQAFGHSWAKAIGFVVLVEGTLILSPIQWLSIGALIYLVLINAVATGTTLALDKRRHFQEKYATARAFIPKPVTGSSVSSALQTTLLEQTNPVLALLSSKRGAEKSKLVTKGRKI